MEKKKSNCHSNKDNKGGNKNADVSIARLNEVPSDVLGSYTGVPEDIYEKPVQDVDDL